MDGGPHEDVSTAAAIAAGRTAARNILLTPEGKATIATVAGLYQDSRFVNKHG